MAAHATTSVTVPRELLPHNKDKERVNREERSEEERERERKNGYDFNACNNVRDSLYDAEMISSIVKLTVHSPEGKLV